MNTIFTSIKELKFEIVTNSRGCSLPRLFLALPNVTAHPSTASVPITVLLLCGLNVPIEVLTNELSGYYAF